MNKKDARPAGVSPGGVVKGIFGVIGRIFVTFVMVGIITGCIVASVLTVFILNYVGSDEGVDLDTVKLGYTSIMYYYDENGKAQELQKLYMSDNNRIWVDYDHISDNAKEAAIAIEDKRFREHQGVDWRRTFGAFVNMFLPGASTGGGSTITQQLIKNVTEDDDLRIDRKVREIFRALELERKYSKDRILEAYLNVVPFGSGTNGIESAAQTYFGKSAKDLNLAESASIVGITKYPGEYSPFINPEQNKERQEWVLQEMLDQGRITETEHDAAVKEKLVLRKDQFQESASSIQTYFEDHVINQVLADLQEQKGWTAGHAFEQLHKGGYRIYTTVDVKMQAYIEDFYLTNERFPAVYNKEYPQSCAVITDTNGKILAMAGGIGEKTGDRMFNRVTMATRQPGSALKPVGPYAVAFESNLVNWSTIIDDNAIKMTNPERLWPKNYYLGYKGNVTVAYAIQQSINTVPAKLVMTMTPQKVFDFLHDKLNFYNLVDRAVIDGGISSDIGPAPMALGALTKGVTPLEMAGGYQIYANGGYFTTPYAYTKVEDSEGRIVLENDTTPRRVISEETAVIVNKALQNVVTAGTGTAANLGGVMPTAGKTGTSEEDVNQWFMGITPYHICAVWLGYDEEKRKNDYGNWVPNSISYGNYPPPILWKSIMAPLQEGLEYKQFPESEGVVSKTYCTVTGYLATANCTSLANGWYKKDRLPSSCPGHAAVVVDEDSDSEQDNDKDKDEDSSESSKTGGNDFRDPDNPDSVNISQ